jgi:hypothetical protein
MVTRERWASRRRTRCSQAVPSTGIRHITSPPPGKPGATGRSTERLRQHRKTRHQIVPRTVAADVPPALDRTAACATPEQAPSHKSNAGCPDTTRQQPQQPQAAAASRDDRRALCGGRHAAATAAARRRRRRHSVSHATRCTYQSACWPRCTCRTDCCLRCIHVPKGFPRASEVQEREPIELTPTSTAPPATPVGRRAAATPRRRPDVEREQDERRQQQSPAAGASTAGGAERATPRLGRRCSFAAPPGGTQTSQSLPRRHDDV